MNKYYGLLSQAQIDNIYRQRKKLIGQYFALWSESGHLNKFMITLSPIVNTMDAVIALRKNFFDKLNNKKHYKKFQVAYFSAIEIGLNKNTPSNKAQISQHSKMKLMQKNFHIHIQLFTTMKASDLQDVISKMDHTLFHFHKISIPTTKNVKYDYVIKDIKNLDWKLQYILKTQYKGKNLYTSSRKGIANYMITKIWNYMKITYKDKWNKIADKYSFVLQLKKQGDLLFWNLNNGNFMSLFKGIDMKKYDEIQIRNKGICIYVKKNII